MFKKKSKPSVPQWKKDKWKLWKNYYWKRSFFHWFLYVCFDIRYQPYEREVTEEWGKMEKEKWDVYQRDYYGENAPNQDLFKNKDINNINKSSASLLDKKIKNGEKYKSNNEQINQIAASKANDQTSR
ncbi:hypothetical protein [Spiroplasma eriocheiris]|uniref:Uncharacterized protein n=1 Tax=Spiroplasma eriocheiris TaxID=315358 RepID=A0A0H3XMU9_9MOLU|nr:hypothetical protein [Spiroplasma eriocheiris]AHF57942.1 hypothetical protein SPE_0820 [Spiroplasma eriocheiris CCTCC M 207170]AKM54382.1 hypothetical protein SERIO_v1c08220 [Spiroplasma eriocheiris]